MLSCQEISVESQQMKLACVIFNRSYKTYFEGKNKENITLNRIKMERFFFFFLFYVILNATQELSGFNTEEKEIKGLQI